MTILFKQLNLKWSSFLEDQSDRYNRFCIILRYFILVYAFILCVDGLGRQSLATIATYISNYYQFHFKIIYFFAIRGFGVLGILKS